MPCQLAGLSIDPIDGLFLVRLDGASRSLLAFVVHQAAIPWIGEPDRTITRVDNRIVRCIERLSTIAIRQDIYATVIFIPDYSAVAMFTGDLSPLEVKCIAVAVSRWGSELRHTVIVLNPPQLNVIGNVTPNQITTDAIPRWTLRPQHVFAVVDPPDG